MPRDYYLEKVAALAALKEAYEGLKAQGEAKHQASKQRQQDAMEPERAPEWQLFPPQINPEEDALAAQTARYLELNEARGEGWTKPRPSGVSFDPAAAQRQKLEMERLDGESDQIKWHRPQPPPVFVPQPVLPPEGDEPGYEDEGDQLTFLGDF